MKVAVHRQASFLLLALVVAIGAVAVKGNEPADIAYVAFFADDQCTKLGGIKGYVSNDEFQMVRATQDFGGNDIGCEAAMSCLLYPTGKSCQSVLAGSDDVATPRTTGDFDYEYVNMTVRVSDDGSNVYECNENDSGECSTLSDPTGCTSSDVYNCHYRWISAETLKSDPLTYLPAQEDTSGLEDYAYKVYFEPEGCLSLAGIRGFVSSENWQLKRVGEDQGPDVMDCQLSMPCFLQPESKTCTDLNLYGEPASITVETRPDGCCRYDVYECDTGNADTGEDQCNILNPAQCKPSSSYNCNFIWVSADTFAKDPVRMLAPALWNGDRADDLSFPDKEKEDSTADGTSSSFGVDGMTMTSMLVVATLFFGLL